MNRTVNLGIIILLVISLAANVALLLMIRQERLSERGATGFSTKASEESPVFEKDVIEISRTDLISCCSFVNSKGEEDNCYVLKGRSCDYCKDYC